ncbi:MAG: ribosomal protection-like ABC-F family protein [Bacteroidota bacterium]
MYTISFNNISFQHGSSSEQLFYDISFHLHTEWRTAVVGRNGRGKSTLLQLISGELQPNSGTIESMVRTALFNEQVTDTDRKTFDVIKQRIAPFTEWERSMEGMLMLGDERSLLRYHELFERFTQHRGFTIDGLIRKECAELGLTEHMLEQSFNTLSGGEQTRANIAALFLKQNAFPLLDEPTNHLDMEGRELLAEYLSGKNGFIVVSHDRYFLDRCCDHVLAINKSGIRIFQGNYSSWREQLKLEEASETARKENLEKEIQSLERAARQRRAWSFVTEKEKHKAADSGFVSHKAAKVMKRALSIERRMNAHIESKRSLLKNRESVRPLIIHSIDQSSEILLSVEEAGMRFGDAVLFNQFSLTVRRGERVAVIGPNGCGKSTLLRVIRKELPLTSGQFRLAAALPAHSYQTPLWNSGPLREILRAAGIDETRFRIVMGTFNISGEIFDRPLETFSFGERKKVDLCRSFLTPNDLLVWDEPVNYIDIESKEQIEAVVLREQPTMLFVEHDRAFVESIATRIIDLSEYQWDPP